MKENINDNKLVRLSSCKACNNLVRVLALEVIDGKRLSSFDREVKKNDLNVETITLGDFKDKNIDFCICE